jgi:MFS-type transporter involved in bile tolerance (Atg22 family)
LDQTSKKLLVIALILIPFAMVGRVFHYFNMGYAVPTAYWAWALVIILPVLAFGLYRVHRYWRSGKF